MTHFTVVKISRFLECFGSQILHDRIKSLTEEGDRGYEVPKRCLKSNKEKTDPKLGCVCVCVCVLSNRQLTAHATLC